MLVSMNREGQITQPITRDEKKNQPGQWKQPGCMIQLTLFKLSLQHVSIERFAGNFIDSTIVLLPVKFVRFSHVYINFNLDSAFLILKLNLV